MDSEFEIRTQGVPYSVRHPPYTGGTLLETTRIPRSPNLDIIIVAWC